LINRLSQPAKLLDQDDIMAAFGEKAFLLLKVGDDLAGVMGWQVENLVARTTGVVIDPQLSAEKALPPLITEMERASRDLQCEASLVFVSGDLAAQSNCGRIWATSRPIHKSWGCRPGRKLRVKQCLRAPRFISSSSGMIG
jgi:hypothetical protein